jgi:DNA primase
MDFAAVATQEFAVSSGSSFDAKELVRQAIDIVDLIGAYMPLRRQGRNFVGLCPWHDDSRPSLQVNPQRQSWKCWVCDIGGDVFSFIMKIEGVTFPEAMAMLADRAGISLKPAKTRATPTTPTSHVEQEDDAAAPAPQAASLDKRTLFKAMAWAEKQYHDCLLNSPEAEPARRYLAERGITAESIEKFHLGFSPQQRDWILRQAGGSSSRARILEAVGLLTRPAEGGNPFDRFKGRVLFSIRDAQGRPVGLGGRILPELGTTSPAKYINSPETPLYSKSNLLYGLDLAKDAIRRGGQESAHHVRTVLVMEGYTDVIVAHQYGFGNAVAVLGTALGEGHIRILRRFADRIVLVLDGDEAGQKRTNEVLELFVAQQVDLRILTLPEDLDPCDYLHKYGAAAMADLLSTRAVDALDHAFARETAGLDLDHDIHGVEQALERLLSVIAKAPRLNDVTDAQRRNREWMLLENLAKATRMPEEMLRGRLKELRRKTPARRYVAQDKTAGGDVPQTAAAPLDPWIREWLQILLVHPECAASVVNEIDEDRLPPGLGRQIHAAMSRLSNAGIVPAFERLMLEFDDPAVKGLLVELDEQGQAKGFNDPAGLLQELIRSAKRKEVEKRRPSQAAPLREKKLDDAAQSRLLEEILQQERRRQGISEPTDG